MNNEQQNAQQQLRKPPVPPPTGGDVFSKGKNGPTLTQASTGHRSLTTIGDSSTSEPSTSTPGTESNGTVTPTRKAGEKRDHQETVTPQKGKAVQHHYALKNPPKKRKIFVTKPKTAANTSGTDGDATMTGGDPPESQATAETIARDLQMAKRTAFWETYTRSNQKPSEGVLKFIDQAFGRYAPATNWMRVSGVKPEAADKFIKVLDDEGKWAWITVYDVPSPSLKLVDTLKQALEHIERHSLVEDFRASEYKLMVSWKSQSKTFPPIVVFTANESAYRRLLAAGSFRYTFEKISATYILQGQESVGTRIILDLKNAPVDEAGFLDSCMRTFGEAIEWKSTSQDGRAEPVAFDFAKVGAKGRPEGGGNFHWKISFKPSITALKEGWQYPTVAGTNGLRGEVEVEEPDFCDKCISYSHPSEYCEWWKDPTASLEAKKPKDFIQLDWKSVKYFLPGHSASVKKTS